MQVSDLVSLLRAFCALHRMANHPMHPIYAGTVSDLLGQCEDHLAEMERGRANVTVRAHAADGENIIHVNFNRPGPPSDGGDAA